MELLWTAFVLGLLGSLHCAGMCGPLAIALPRANGSRLSFTAGRLVYNAGRIATYCAIGLVFGLLGRSLALAGFQRWVSLGAGLLVLAGAFLSVGTWSKGSLWAAVGWLKRAFSAALQRRSAWSMLLMGSLNGLLPCGLVYVAAAGATATGGVRSGLVYMAAFGIGTLPVMLGMGLAGKLAQGTLRFRLQRLLPLSVACLGLLLVLRGLGLGVPYLSPALDGAGAISGHCH